jgi:subtilisin family serine protease
MMRFALLALICLAGPSHAAIGAFPPESAPEVRFRQDRIVVRLAPGAALRLSQRGARGATSRLLIAGVDRVAERLGVRGFHAEFQGPLAGPGTELSAFWFADLPENADPHAAAAAFMELEEVAEAHPIAIFPVSGVPNDSLWSISSHLYQDSRRDVHALEAWSVTRGDSSIVLAVLDTGVLLDHPDLAGQLWKNAAERGGLPGIDDDGNGYVDDIDGWDFVSMTTGQDAVPLEDWRDEDNDPNDFAGHGTAVSGIAAARSNNTIGITGTAWDIRIMPLRVGWSSPVFALGLVDLSFAARAITYAAANGAHVINCSFGSNAQSDFLAAVNAAANAGVLVVFSSGNNGTPAIASQLPGVMSVAATGPADVVTQFSNLHVTVALSAPGQSLPATFIAHAGGDSLSDRQPVYTAGASGTSFSAPIAAAAAALVQSRRVEMGLPLLRPLDMKLLLMETTDAIDPLNSRFTNYGTGRLNAGRALEDGLRSFRVRAAGKAVGPSVAIPALRGESRIAFAMDSRELLFIGGSSRDTLLRVALPDGPVGAIAAADPGTGIGTVIWVACADRRIYAYDLLGRPVAGWPVIATAVSGPFAATPVPADLDGDGVLEVLWGGNDGRVHAWRADGSPLPGFPRDVSTGGPNLILALADLDGAPGAEIVAAAGSGTVIALDGGGATLPGWPQQLAFPAIDVIVADIGGMAGPEVIAAGGSLVVAWRANGTLVWSRTMPVLVGSGLAAADFDGNGTSEVVAPLLDRIAVIGNTGSFHPGFPKVTDALVAGPPVVGGITSVTPIGILVGCADEAGGFRLRGISSSAIRLARYPLPGGAGPFVTLANLDGDDATEIVAGTGSEGSLWVYDAGPSTWRAPGWPTPGGNSARTRSNIAPPSLSAFDDVAPAAVEDLAALRRTPTHVTLRWTGVADEGPSGVPEHYEIAASDQPFGPDGFDDAPGRQTAAADSDPLEIEFDDLPAGVPYYFAVRSIDAYGNVSPMSNLAALNQPVPVIASGVRIASLRNPTGVPVALGWLAGSDVPEERRTVRIFDVGGRLLSRLRIEPGFEGVVEWNGRDLFGRTVPPGLYFARLETPSHSATARFALIR